MPTPPEALSLGDTAPDFSLPGVDGRTVGLANVSGRNGTVVMFICNHCPYVKAVADRIVSDMAALRELGIGRGGHQQQRRAGVSRGWLRADEGLREAARLRFPVPP